MKILKHIIKAQSTLEFTLAMIGGMFLIYGLIHVFRWAGMDLAQRRYAQETSLVNLTTPDPASELNPVDYPPAPMAAIYPGNITNESNGS